MISEYLIMKIIAVLILAGLVSGKTAPRELLFTEDDIDGALKEAKDGIEDFATSIWGKFCLLDEACMKYVAYCDREKGFGIVGINVTPTPGFGSVYWLGLLSRL